MVAEFTSREKRTLKETVLVQTEKQELGGKKSQENKRVRATVYLKVFQRQKRQRMRNTVLYNFILNKMETLESVKC
jgi:hypothetical protein